MADAHVPFHAVVNYDGQLTNQHGIHSRFETELFLRYQERLSIRKLKLIPVPDAKALVFDALITSFLKVPAVLEADSAAAAGRQAYDAVYFDRFFDQTQSVLEEQLSHSIKAVASVVVAAWEEAGSPDLLQKVERPPRRIRP